MADSSSWWSDWFGSGSDSDLSSDFDSSDFGGGSDSGGDGID